MPKRFFFIGSTEADNQDSGKLSRTACEARGVEFIECEPSTFDLVNGPKPADGDILYRAAQHYHRGAREIEHALIHEKVATFYSDYFRSQVVLDDDFWLMSKAGVPIPPTVGYITRNRAQIDAAVEALGGFPIIVKVMGGNRGVGTMKIDSTSSLYGVVDFLAQKGEKFIFRKFLNVVSQPRLLVLGNEVIASISYELAPKDFRSDIPRPLANVSDAAKEMAIKAVHADQMEFGGVDILIDDSGKEYVAEANMPCYFPRGQQVTGIDVAGMMVDYLIKKSEKLTV